MAAIFTLNVSIHKQWNITDCMLEYFAVFVCYFM